jgi:hypothetical protein
MGLRTFRRAAWIGLLFAALVPASPSIAWSASEADAAGPAAPNTLPAAPAPTAKAQESQSLETLRLEQPSLGKPGKVKLVEEAPSRRKWIALAVAEHGAAAFDAYTTRQAIARGAVEADPLMRPFANSPSIYVAIQLAPLALDYAARRMQRSQNEFVRKMWWLPQTGSTAMCLFSGAHNLTVAGKP